MHMFRTLLSNHGAATRSCQDLSGATGRTQQNPYQLFISNQGSRLTSLLVGSIVLGSCIALTGCGGLTVTGSTSGAVPALSSLTCSNSSISGASMDSCTVTLSKAAPGTGFLVTLASSSAAVSVPASLTVASGTTSIGFTAEITSVSSTQNVTLTSSAEGVNESFVLKLSPQVAGGTGNPTLSGLSCNSGTVSGSGTDSCTVTLSGSAPSGGLAVDLSSNNKAVTVPASVTIPANASTIGFTTTFSAVSTAETATVTSSAEGVSKTFALKLSPQVAGGTGTPTLTLNASSVSFGDVALGVPSTQSVTLSSTGTGAVIVSGVSMTGTGFSDSGITFPLTLNAGKTATLNLQFEPTATGAATGQLTVNSNSSQNSKAVIPLSGTGVPLAIALNWQAPSGSTVAGYNIYRATGSSSSFSKLNSSVNAPDSYTDGAVKASTTYEYYVTSIDSSGMESAPSNTATIVVP